MNVKSECKQILSEYADAIWAMATWVYHQPYESLPYSSQKAIRHSAKEIIENRIYELTEVT